RLNTSLSSAARAAVEPAPEVTASSVRAVSTSTIVSVGAAAAVTSSDDRVAHPTPMRPWRGVPVRNPTAGATSAGSSRRRRSTNAATLAVRFVVAVAAVEASTTAASEVTGQLNGKPEGAVSSFDQSSQGGPAMRLSMNLSYACGFKESAQQVADLERAGLDIVWVAEAYTFDAISQMGYLAAKTERIQIGSGIVNVYSRTPALMAMTFAGLDYVSDGRAICGLGASGPQVVEGFHGVPYEKPMT